MPTKLCANPACAQPATSRGRCKAHARTNDRQINRAGRRIYNTKRWKLTRRRVLFDQPICPGIDQACGALTEDVHHIVDIDDGGDPWARSNLTALCHSCHSRHTRHGQTTSSRKQDTPWLPTP